ncbi:MAG: OmpH family outer membrane protein [Bacteroidaceae bacterium]|nr:OmpH family outer membrane protein [Bacteroidaceae bacterium]
MIKKFLAIALIALAPLSVFSQKFGSINSADIMQLMPERQAADAELETLRGQYREEFEYMESEYNKKVEDYKKQAETLPDNIRQRREQEIMDSEQKINEYLQNCDRMMNEKVAQLQNDIVNKLLKAIKAVGEEGSFVCIFDTANGSVPFVSSALTTDVTEAVKAKLGIK